MIRMSFLALAAGTMSIGSSVQISEGGTAAAAQAELPIEWTISPAADAGKVQFRLEYSRRPGHQSSTSRTTDLADLQGLGEGQLRGSGPASFRIVKDAGTLNCRGNMERGRGIGTCSFRGDPAFAAELERRSIGRASSEDLFQLAIHNVSRDLMSELERNGYAKPALKDLVAAGIHGVTPGFVRGMAQAGYRLGSIERLVEFRIHGVTPDYVRELASANPNLVRLHADKLVEMRIHGVTPALVRSLNEAGYRELAPSQIVELRIHGVSPDFIRGMGEAGYRNLTARQLVEMRIHGVSPQYVREIAESGYRGLASSDLVAMRIHGVSGDWVRQLHRAGCVQPPRRS
jgi:hypothetical protein